MSATQRLPVKAMGPTGKPVHNRLVPVPPPKDFQKRAMQGAEEEKKERGTRKQVPICQQSAAQIGTSPLSLQSKTNKTRASTAKSTTSFYSGRQTSS